MLVALALVASGISSLWVSAREWTNFLPATVIWATESVMPGLATILVVTLGRGGWSFIYRRS